MAITSIITLHPFLSALVIVIVYLIIRYLYKSNYFKNIGLVTNNANAEMENLTKEEKIIKLEEKYKKLEADEILNLKTKILEEKIKKLEPKKESSGFFNSGGEFFDTDLNFMGGEK